MKKHILFLTGMLAAALTFGLILAGCEDATTPAPAPDARTLLTAGAGVHATAVATSANVTFTGATGLTLDPADFAVSAGGNVTNVAVAGTTATVTVGFSANADPTAKIYTVSVAAASTKIRAVTTAAVTQAAAVNAPEVTVTPGDAKLTIAWTAVTGETLGYKVYISNQATAPTELNLATATATQIVTYTASGQQQSGLNIANNIQYYVWVRARLTAVTDSELSVVKTGTPMPPASVPGKPAGLTVTSPPSGQVKVTWTAVDLADDYEVFIANDANNPDGNNGNRAEGQANITQPLEYTTRTLSSNTQYYVHVRAHNSQGNGAWSDSISITTVKPVDSVVGTWVSGSGFDTLVFTAPNSCARTDTTAQPPNSAYTYAYALNGGQTVGNLTLTPVQGAAIQGTVTGNVLTVATWGATAVYTKQP
jgi:uncharacterized lipoprotein YbaY